jgi:hypothetical protein
MTLKKVCEPVIRDWSKERSVDASLYRLSTVEMSCFWREISSSFSFLSLISSSVYQSNASISSIQPSKNSRAGVYPVPSLSEPELGLRSDR